MIPDPKRVDMPRTKGLRIEAPGCTVYIDHREGGGTTVEVIPDGARYPDRCMLGRIGTLQAGRIVYGQPTALGLRIVVDQEERAKVRAICLGDA